MTAAEYALILDPERKQDGWWLKVCPNCGMAANIAYSYGSKLQVTVCKNCGHFLGQPNPFDNLVASSEDYIGPPDLHTAREHAWRGEEWLEARDVGWIRHITETLPGMTCVMVGHGTDNPRKVCNKNHAAAIAEAVRKVHDGQQ